MDEINSSVFDGPDELDRIDKLAKYIWPWRQTVWPACARSGLGKLHVFNTPRHFGNTWMARRVAAEGFPPGTKVTLVVNSERQQALNHGSDYECVAGLDVPHDAEVVIFDYHGISPADCAALRARGATVLVFGNGIEREFEECADEMFSFRIPAN